MTGRRLDTAVVERGLARSRTQAAAAIAAGRVRVGGGVVTRPGVRVEDGTPIEVTEGDGRVGRGGGKLDAALDAFALDPAGRLCLDLGASTGGFTQSLLRRGARSVIALDVGHDQLVPELRADPRVLVVEGENARDLTPQRLVELTGSPERPSVVVADLSFIGLGLVIPAIARSMESDADVVLLIKPQFEVGRERVRSGVVTDPELQHRVVADVLRVAADHGLGTLGVIASPMLGGHGNREVLAHLGGGRPSDPAEWAGSIARAVRGQEAG